MKIGILTFHHVPNYGSVLQAYALTKYLNSLQNVNAEIIDYRPPKAVKAFLLWHLKSPIVLHNILKIYKFKKFINKRLPLSYGPVNNADKLIDFSNEYDAFIVGSDQVWTDGPPRGYDESYYLTFTPSGTAFSFSASFGSTTNLDYNLKGRIAHHLKKFKLISVRDTNSARIVQKITGKAPIVTCDPTFLVDFEEFIGISMCAKPYLLLFGRFWWLPKEFINEIRDRGLIVISIGNYNPRARGFYSADPGEWVNTVSNASAILTTYFHGTIFAIKYNKPFISLVGPRSGKTLKIKSLAKQFGLEERIFERGEYITENIDLLFRRPNNIQTKNIIEESINISKNYLKKIARVAKPPDNK